MSDAPVVKTTGKGKKPANQTQAYVPKLTAIEPEACEAYLQAIGFRKNGSDWANPPEMNLPPDFKIIAEAGSVSGIVGGKKLTGYRLIAWLICRSKARGIHAVMIGALVMVGIHDLELFRELEGFSEDQDNYALKIMKAANLARGYYKNGAAEKEHISAESDAPEVSQTEEIETPLRGQIGFNNTAGDAISEKKAGLNEGSGLDEIIERLDDSQEFASSEAGRAADDGIDAAVHRQSAGREDRPEQVPGANETGDKDGSDDPPIDSVELAAVLKAFNGSVPSAGQCRKKLQQNNQDQFCAEVQVGRLLLQQKKGFKSAALFSKWKEEAFPKKKFDANLLSRCSRYAQFYQSLKSRRGLLLQERDIQLCPKKTMLLIGGYKKRNADALIDEVIARLDRGEHLSHGAVRDLIKEFKARVAKPKQHEMEPPPDPRTIHDLFDLPEKWLSPLGRKHLMEFQELLESLEPLVHSTANEAAVVLPLVKVFTIL